VSKNSEDHSGIFLLKWRSINFISLRGVPLSSRDLGVGTGSWGGSYSGVLETAPHSFLTLH